MRGFTPGECLNCQSPSEHNLFCGARCRQIAKTIRYVRRKRAEGTDTRLDVAEAIQMRIAQLAEGSLYDERVRRVSPADRRELLTRSGGHCEKCGAAFTEDGDRRFTVQHTETEDGFITEAWCYRCNMDDANSKLQITTDPEHLAFFTTLKRRYEAKKPLLICDDEKNWPTIWRKMRYPI